MKIVNYKGKGRLNIKISPNFKIFNSNTQILISCSDSKHNFSPKNQTLSHSINKFKDYTHPNSSASKINLFNILSRIP